MILNHIDIHVHDVAATRDFFIEHFGLEHLETRGADFIAILTDQAGSVIVFSKPVEKFGSAANDARDRQTFHIGFLLDTRAGVDETYGRLVASGAEVGEAPRMMHHAYAFYCSAPGRILVEVAHRQ